jgi:hypothetical protein
MKGKLTVLKFKLYYKIARWLWKKHKISGYGHTTEENSLVWPEPGHDEADIRFFQNKQTQIRLRNQRIRNRQNPNN